MQPPAPRLNVTVYRTRHFLGLTGFSPITAPVLPTFPKKTNGYEAKVAGLALDNTANHQNNLVVTTPRPNSTTSNLNTPTPADSSAQRSPCPPVHGAGGA